MKKIVFACMCLLATSVAAAETDSITIPTLRLLLTETMEHAVVYQDSAITRMLDARINGLEKQTVEVAGFRVQVYSSNKQQVAKNEALTLEKQLSSQLDIPVYVQYNPPFWKVRLGNFRTQAEAQEYKTEFVKLHPELQGETYIVRDQVLVER